MSMSSLPPHRRGHAWSYGRIIPLVEPHSCVVDTSSGEVRRNRAQVRMAALPPTVVPPSPPYVASSGQSIGAVTITFAVTSTYSFQFWKAATCL